MQRKEDFGTVTISFSADTESDMKHPFRNQHVFEEGKICLQGGKLVPLHTHIGGPRKSPFTETYTLHPDGRTHDVRFITLPNVEADNLSTDDLKNLLEHQAPMAPGVPYFCKPNFSHAIMSFNQMGCVASISTLKFYID